MTYVSAQEVVGVYQVMKKRGIKLSQDVYVMLLNAAAPGGNIDFNYQARCNNFIF